MVLAHRVPPNKGMQPTRNKQTSYPQSSRRADVPGVMRLVLSVMVMFRNYL